MLRHLAFKTEYTKKIDMNPFTLLRKITLLSLYIWLIHKMANGRYLITSPSDLH